MRRFLHHLLRFFAMFGMFFLCLALIICSWHLSSNLASNRLALFCGIGFFAGIVIFPYFRLIPVYVCGHELTHWFAAKLFMRETGKFSLRLTRGHVQVANPNVWIILAPYFVPFNLLVIMGVYGLLLFLIDPMPKLAVQFFAGILGAAYAYHLVLTFIAVRAGQQDLRFKGPIFSMFIIVTGNICFLFLALLSATRQWQAGGKLLLSQAMIQIDWLTWIGNKIWNWAKMAWPK